MPTANLTKRTIDAADAGARDQFLWDTEVSGLGVKITPAGRKVFVFQYWSPVQRMKRRRLTLGLFGMLTLDQARAQATRYAGEIAAGHDPAEQRRARREQAHHDATERTVRVLSSAFLDDVVDRRKPRTAAEYRRILERYVLAPVPGGPLLADTPLTAVTPAQAAALHGAVARTSGKVMANRVNQVCKSLFNWSAARGYASPGGNPFSSVEPYPESAGERFLSPAELARVGAALAKAEREGIPPAEKHRGRPRRPETAKHRPKSPAVYVRPANPFTVAAIRFLLLTGMRLREGLHLRWDAVDLKGGRVTLADSKTGRSVRPIGAPAVQLLAALPRVKGSPYVFPSHRNPGRPLSDVKRLWAAVREAAGVADVRVHDLRHTVASAAVSSGHSLFITGKLLGHARSETTQRYAHLEDDAQRAAADAVATGIASALENTAEAR